MNGVTPKLPSLTIKDFNHNPCHFCPVTECFYSNLCYCGLASTTVPMLELTYQWIVNDKICVWLIYIQLLGVLCGTNVWHTYIIYGWAKIVWDSPFNIRWLDLFLRYNTNSTPRDWGYTFSYNFAISQLITQQQLYKNADQIAIVIINFTYIGSIFLDSRKLTTNALSDNEKRISEHLESVKKST